MFLIIFILDVSTKVMAGLHYTLFNSVFGSKSHNYQDKTNIPHHFGREIKWKDKIKWCFGKKNAIIFSDFRHGSNFNASKDQTFVLQIWLKHIFSITILF